LDYNSTVHSLVVQARHGASALAPANPRDDPPRDETTDSPGDKIAATASDEVSDSSNDGAKTWTLTQEVFDKLLEQFSSEREEAGKRYLAMRVRLARYFEYQKVPSPEPLIDITVDRIARKVFEHHTISNLMAYALTVARFVFLEWLRHPDRFLVDVEGMADPPARPPDEQKQARLLCLDNCLDKLTIQSRKLILGYYSDEGRAKIDHRIKIAEALSIPLNALRIRAHRIRTKLEECLKNCLEGRNENGSVTL
jgi:DNA-directed RNA polymerase specialized sigma24 family protein